MNYELLFLLSLVLTIFIETTVLIIVVRHFLRIDKDQASDVLLLFSGIFASFATLPYLWFVLPFFIRDHYLNMMAGESLVFLVESVIYYFLLKIGIRKALILSCICNLISFLAGLLIVPALYN
ncbi:hypothetical protein SAMN04488696_0794 [Methanolobus profundi]|uniref:Uncharacterized protein n=2 Tax=Methanolobus profundi TaxID=487685 RepID=A0A1I4PNQ0_9EURY|nr:hypothetical protein SAMN04488696_0794 [Methanolobus profundi]